jgi:hypothetical protein
MTTLSKTAVALLAIMAAATTRAVAQDGDIVLRIGGAEGAVFKADCELKSAEGTQTFSVEQTVPFEASYVGSGLVCSVSSGSRIDVEVAKGGCAARCCVSSGTARVNVGS